MKYKQLSLAENVTAYLVTRGEVSAAASTPFAITVMNQHRYDIGLI